MITGAAGNLGRCVAAAFDASGANLVLVDLRRESLEQAFGAEDKRRLFAPTNLLEQQSVNAAVEAALGRFGRIDVLCNLAGGFRMPQADPKRWVAPQDLASVIAFLASDAARAIHGAALPVTGLS